MFLRHQGARARPRETELCADRERRANSDRCEKEDFELTKPESYVRTENSSARRTKL